MYTYNQLTDDINYLKFNGVQTGSIGKSLLGNEIYYIHTGGTQGKQLIVTGGIHARENVTALLVIRQAYRHLNMPMGIYFLPMLNPDGALIINRGAAAAGKYASLVSECGGDFSLWKANARAVDLNNNFDAKFGTGKCNVTHPASHGYVGEFPFSEPETQALRDFTLDVMPCLTVSYHALGREVYWYFGQKDLRDKLLADKAADYLGYRVVDGDLGSAGGYKDWCVMRGIPALTVEIGSDELNHPVSQEDVADDIRRNLDLPAALMQFYKEIYCKNQ